MCDFWGLVKLLVMGGFHVELETDDGVLAAESSYSDNGKFKDSCFIYFSTVKNVIYANNCNTFTDIPECDLKMSFPENSEEEQELLSKLRGME